MCKRPLQDSGTSVKKRQRTSSAFGSTDIGDLKFLFFTAASCSGLCQGCDKCHPEECEPKEANAIKKDGIIYKRVGHGFDLTFASLTCLFIRMREDFKCHWTPTAKKPDHNGRLKVSITDDYGKPMGSQALKFTSLAWGQLTPAAKLATADMPLRDFGRTYQVDHIDGNPSNNDVSNAMIMTKAEHDAKTKKSAAQRANQAMSHSAPCTMTVFVSKGKPLLDSEEKPIVENYDHRKKVMDDYKLKKSQIADSIKRKDTTRNSLVKIKYKGQDCLAQFSWYNLPDLEGEIWKPVTETDHKTMELPMSEKYDYFVSNMSRFKFVTKSTQNAKIRDFRGQKRPPINLMNKNLYFHRIVALVFHRKQMDEYIAEQFIKTGIVWTFAKGPNQPNALDVDHIDFKSTNHCANNLQFLTPEENKARSNNRPCRIWEIGKKDAEIEYSSVKAASYTIGLSLPTVRKILKNKKYMYKEWRGEYIVE